jgi:hypothetical protein
MLSNKEKNTLLVSNIIAIVISLIVCVPFGKSNVTSFELIAKFIIAPILIAILVGITTYTKYSNFQPANKFIFVSAYTPFFSYLGASLFSTLLAVIRTTNGFSQYYQWLLTLIVLVTVFVLVAIVNHMIHRWILVFTKNELMIVDTVMLILAIFLTFILHSTVSKHVDVVLQAVSILYILVPLLFGLLFAAFHVLRIIYLHSSKESFKIISHKELVAKWKEERDKLYSESEVDILYGLYSFSKNELGLSDELDDLYDEIIEELEAQEVIPTDEEDSIKEEPQVAEPVAEEIVEEKPKEEPVKEEPVVEEPKVEEPVPLIVKPEPVVVKRVVEVVNEVELELISKEQQALQAEREKLEEMQKAKLEQLMEVEKDLAQVEEKLFAATLKKERKPKTPPVVKEFKPSFEEVLNYVRVIPDVTEKANATQTSYRFMVDNKPFLVLQNSAKDYKITFLYELDEVVDLIVNTPNVVKAKSPKGDNWFKLTNKGDYTEDQIFDIIDKSHRMLTILEERKLQAKEQARLAKLEVKIREREAIRLQKEKEREAERLRKQKEKEAAKLKAQREKEKERQRIQAQKEKEKAKLKAQREKEREKARLKAQKEREAAKLKAQKEKEREVERLRKQKEKEAAKLKAQKEKEAAKLKAQAEKNAQEEAAQKTPKEQEGSTPKEAA